jgi:hypothetical protein
MKTINKYRAKDNSVRLIILELSCLIYKQIKITGFPNIVDKNAY